MGHYRVTIVGLGGHGCQREKGTGEAVVGCDRHGCPDCQVRELVRRLKRSGENISSAQIEHWPADLGYPPETVVVDDLLTGIRRGNFPERDERARAMAIEKVAEVHARDGSVMYARTLTTAGGNEVRFLIEQALGKTGELVSLPEGHRVTRGLQGVGDADEAGFTTTNQYDLLVDGHHWRLCNMDTLSAFPLGMEVRHLAREVRVVPSRQAGGDLD